MPLSAVQQALHNTAAVPKTSFAPAGDNATEARFYQLYSLASWLEKYEAWQVHDVGFNNTCLQASSLIMTALAKCETALTDAQVKHILVESCGATFLSILIENSVVTSWVSADAEASDDGFVRMLCYGAASALNADMGLNFDELLLSFDYKIDVPTFGMIMTSAKSFHESPRLKKLSTAAIDCIMNGENLRSKEGIMKCAKKMELSLEGKKEDIRKRVGKRLRDEPDALQHMSMADLDSAYDNLTSSQYFKHASKEQKTGVNKAGNKAKLATTIMQICKLFP